MNSVKAAEALFRRNALACETAKGRTCNCRCGGILHGQKHPENWVELQLQEMASILNGLTTKEESK